METLIRQRRAVPPATLARGLMEHQDWYVPAAVARAAGVKGAPLEALPQAGVLEGNMAIFTAKEHIRFFRIGGAAGYTGGVPGHQLFSSLDDRLGSIEINPLGPEDERMQITRDGFPGLRLWAHGIAFETRLRGTSQKDAAEILHRYRVMREFGHYLVVKWTTPEGSGRPFRMEIPDLPGIKFVLAFSALDRLDACLAAIPAGERSQLDVSAAIAGEDLFRGLAQADLGMLLNFPTTDSALMEMVVPRLWDTVLSAE
ncbi:hypothetical protein [Actinoallomurus sp. CA-150999]|uniref:hypothetical protein n=1 Tax=Actinoallomurus sp. CA-150999 TaxID=3239887 RepID=UPI003D8B4FE2